MDAHQPGRGEDVGGVERHLPGLRAARHGAGRPGHRDSIERGEGRTDRRFVPPQNRRLKQRLGPDGGVAVALVSPEGRRVVGRAGDVAIPPSRRRQFGSDRSGLRRRGRKRRTDGSIIGHCGAQKERQGRPREMTDAPGGPHRQRRERFVRRGTEPGGKRRIADMRGQPEHAGRRVGGGLGGEAPLPDGVAPGRAVARGGIEPAVGEEPTGGLEATIEPGGAGGEWRQPLDADPLGHRGEDRIAAATADRDRLAHRLARLEHDTPVDLPLPLEARRQRLEGPCRWRPEPENMASGSEHSIGGIEEGGGRDGPRLPIDRQPAPSGDEDHRWKADLGRIDKLPVRGWPADLLVVRGGFIVEVFDPRQERLRLARAEYSPAGKERQPRQMDQLARPVDFDERLNAHAALSGREPPAEAPGGGPVARFGHRGDDLESLRQRPRHNAPGVSIDGDSTIRPPNGKHLGGIAVGHPPAVDRDREGVPAVGIVSHAHPPLLHHQGVAREDQRRGAAGRGGRGERNQGGGDEPAEADGGSAVGGIEPESDALAERRQHPAKPPGAVGDEVHPPPLGKLLPLGRGVAANIPRRSAVELHKELAGAGRKGEIDNRPDEIRILAPAAHRQPIRPLAEIADRAVGSPAVRGGGEVGHDDRALVASRRAAGPEKEGKEEGRETEAGVEVGHGIGRWAGSEARQDAPTGYLVDRVRVGIRVGLRAAILALRTTPGRCRFPRACGTKQSPMIAVGGRAPIKFSAGVMIMAKKKAAKKKPAAAKKATKKVTKKAVKKAAKKVVKKAKGPREGIEKTIVTPKPKSKGSK